MPWTDFAGEQLRQVVHGAIEEATGRGLPVTDPLADELLWAAESEAIPLSELREWIYDSTAHVDELWSAAAFIRAWRARQHDKPVPERCEACGARIDQHHLDCPLFAFLGRIIDSECAD